LIRPNPKATCRKNWRSRLAGLGYTRLEQLKGANEDEVLKLHGMGPKAMQLLRQALEARGFSFTE
jgi:hypothetical protein